MARKLEKNPRSRDNRILRTLILIVAAVACFCAGYLVRGNDAIMIRLGVIEDPNAVTTTTETASQTVSSRLAEVESVMTQNSAVSYDVDTVTLQVIDSYLTSTGDSLARYFDSDRLALYNSSSTNSYPGVGVYFGEYQGEAYAVDVFDGSSAAEEGVQSGDFVVAINGDRSQVWSATEVINSLQGSTGSTVVITWRRPESDKASGGTEFTTTLTYGDFTEANVTTELTSGVGYIQLKQISQNAEELVTSAINTLTDQGATVFVLDLRDNAGGYLTEAVDVASLFVKSGTVVSIETKDSTTTKDASGNVITDAPLVVLVNGNTSGSAEVLAAALRDSYNATLVGATTMGKGSVQMVKPLSYGGAIRYSVARFITPAGNYIDGIGVTPNVSVTNDADSKTDTQKQLAIETATELASSVATTTASADTSE